MTAYRTNRPPFINGVPLVTDRPILFSAPMVRALLDGRKTQTRRVLKPKKQSQRCLLSSGWTDDYILDPGNREWLEQYYRWRVGDRLWVRETWRCNGWASDVATIFYRASEGDGYTAMCEQWPVVDRKPLRVETKWAPSLHLPRWASRLTLTVTDVRVQRIQGIRHADAKAEGVLPFAPHRAPQGGSCDGDSSGFDDCARCAFKLLWADITGGEAWFQNPWVVAVSFRAAHHNIDQPALLTSWKATINERDRRGSPKGA